MLSGLTRDPRTEEIGGELNKQRTFLAFLTFFSKSFPVFHLLTGKGKLVQNIDIKN